MASDDRTRYWRECEGNQEVSMQEYREAHRDVNVLFMLSFSESRMPEVTFGGKAQQEKAGQIKLNTERLPFCSWGKEFLIRDDLTVPRALSITVSFLLQKHREF